MQETLPRRIFSTRHLILIVGDLLALLIFAAIGRRSHGEAAGLDALLEIARTAAPFIGGWFAVAPLLGAFRAAGTSGPAAMIRETALAWLVALPVGALLRVLMIGRFSPPSFYVVTFLTVLILLGGWRAVYALVEQKQQA